MAFKEDSLFRLKFLLIRPAFVRQHSVDVDPEVSVTICAFYDFSIEGDCWHCLSYCFAADGVPQGLGLALNRFRTLSFGTIVTLFLAASEQRWLLCGCHWLFCRLARRRKCKHPASTIAV